MREITSEVAVTRGKGYARSAEGAGKMLAHLYEAGCSTPSVVLFGDGSGHFEIEQGDQGIADETFTRFLGRALCKSRSRRPGDPSIEYSIGFRAFDTYRDVCRACDRPL